MPSRVARNNFTSGIIDPALHARFDLEQLKTGLRQGTNMLPLPQGGAIRFPGTKMVNYGLSDDAKKMAKFKFNFATQYRLIFRNLFVDIYDPTTEAKVTQVATPYTSAMTRKLGVRAQLFDTMVIFDGAKLIAPHRLVRGDLADNPIRTFAASVHTIRVNHPDHGLLENDEIGIAGITGTTGGVVLGHINTSHTISLVDGATGASNPVTTTSTGTSTQKRTIRVVVPGNSSDGLVTGERIKFSGLTAGNNIPATELNKARTITATGGSGATSWVEVVVESMASATGTGGGTAGAWSAPDFYEITVVDTASGNATGGGTAGKSWFIHSLKPNTSRAVALKNLPQFDFKDSSSPEPKRAIQRLAFDGFLAAESYNLVIQIPAHSTQNGSRVGSTSIRTPFLDWDSAAPANNATVIQDAINAATGTDDVTGTVAVSYDSTVSAGAGGSASDHYEYVFEFADALNYDPIQPQKIRSASGTITHVTAREVQGGSTEEDVISDTRGWPSWGIFYLGRLWMVGMLSRPGTYLASKTGPDPFDFDVGAALDGDAIDQTGESDPVLYLIAERGLWALTGASEIPLSGRADDQAAITPTNVNLKTSSRFGAREIPPVAVSGRPIYVDRIGRVRQLGAGDSGAIESKDIGILSQFLFDDPFAMDLWSNIHGDYIFVLNGDGDTNDNSLAVLCVNTDQGVAGWTERTTDGRFLDVCEINDKLYVLTKRDLVGSPFQNVEVFDFDYFTDSAVQATGSAASSWGGLTHLEGLTVQVRGDAKTMEDCVVATGLVTTKNGDILVDVTAVEAGLAIPEPTLEPMPPKLESPMAIVRVQVDFLDTRQPFIDGFEVKPYLPGAVVTGAASPLITGLVDAECRDWGDRMSTVITAPKPQPCHVRAVLFEVA